MFVLRSETKYTVLLTAVHEYSFGKTIAKWRSCGLTFAMMKLKATPIAVAVLSTLLVNAACAQHASRKGFRSPLDIPLNLSGNFGEFRTNHFHTGLDLKTQGREGLTVFAVTGGCVSRIRVSPYGYGNALYIDHPNGYTSVYAHLSSFNDAIDQYLVEAQYALESWEVDLYPGAGTLCVDSAEIIAQTGNSGTSGGPHLHFEIRETESEFPVNPLLWDFPVQDTRAPLVHGILFSPLNDSSEVLGTRQPQLLKTQNSSGVVRLQRTSPVEVSGDFGIGVHTLDLLDGNTNPCGIYRISVLMQGDTLYEQRIDRLDFSINRQLNAHADYRLLQTERKSIHRTFLLPENRLPIYKTIKGNGAIALAPGEAMTLSVEVADVHGNVTALSFDLLGVPPRRSKQTHLVPRGAQLFAFDQPNVLRSDSCTIRMPRNRLYDDAWVWIDRPSGREADASAHFEVGNRYEPLHDWFELSIVSRINAPELVQKLLIVKYDPERKRYSAVGGHWHRGTVTAQVKNFGEYAIALDTIAPVIKPLRVDKKRLEFKVTDNLSGIDFIEARVNGAWIRMHYDPKRNLIWHDGDADQKLPADGGVLVLKVTDERGNVAVFERKL